MKKKMKGKMPKKAKSYPGKKKMGMGHKMKGRGMGSKYNMGNHGSY